MVAKIITNSVRRWSKYRQAERELASLSSRELADLGLTRSDIPRIAAQAASQL